jgi:hypothetical protein
MSCEGKIRKEEREKGGKEKKGGNMKDKGRKRKENLLYA